MRYKIICRNCRQHKTLKAFPKDMPMDCNKCVKELYKFHLERLSYYKKLCKTK